LVLNRGSIEVGLETTLQLILVQLLVPLVKQLKDLISLVGSDGAQLYVFHEFFSFTPKMFN
jgi:hypothetical protein